LRIDLTVDPQGFLGQGEVFVFASVLNEFFALYALMPTTNCESPAHKETCTYGHPGWANNPCFDGTVLRHP
jgi:hypothetical protein